MRRRPLALALLAVLLGACAGRPPPSESPIAVAEAPVVDGDQRLGHEAVPTAYALDLTIDPARETFTGQGEIAVTLAAPTDRIALHAQGLTFTRSEAQIGARVVAGTATPGVHGGLAVTFAEPLPAGDVVLRFGWTAPLAAVPDGLYRVKEGEDWYAFTQFEALHARQAFPCFDQPEFKTPWQVTLRVPDGQWALANSREIGRRTEGGLTVVNFARTPPLPTYLVAFAVGPFDVVPAAAEAIPGVPLRLVATRGKGILADYALEQTPAIHAALEAWFGQPHGFDKLDLVAVPNFSAGAMENPGLVTFRETLLLLDGERAPAQRKMWALSVIAHELAHLWFGDRVTMAWWNDLWLNEAFATWMSSRIVAAVAPDLEADLEAVAEARYVMSLDAQQSSRAIRQPIASGGDVENAFDGITYGKGAAVLRMTEAWLGAEVFQAGVRRYLEAHAQGNATTADLLAALKAASGKDVAAMMQRFLDQPGVPLVSVQVACPAGGKASVVLSQQRYRTAGSEVAPGEPWQVPVCVRFAAEGGESVQQCFLLAGATGRFELSTGCPAWLHPNAHQQGYYQWALLDGEGPGLAALLQHASALSISERVALPGVLAALLEADALPVPAYLDALRALGADPHRVVIEGVLDGLVQIDQVAIDDALRRPFARFVRELLKPHADRLGFAPRGEEPVADRLLRPRILNTLAYLGADESLRAQARETVERYLTDPRSVPQEQAIQALPVAAWAGDAALWDRLKAAYAVAPDPTLQSAVLRALASFEDPALFTRTLDLVLDGTLRAQDFSTVARGAGRPTTRRAGFAWLEAKYADVVRVVGPAVAPRLPYMAGGFCSAEQRDRVAAFFGAAEHAPDGTGRNLGRILERIDRCVRLRASLAEPVARWLSAYEPDPVEERPPPPAGHPPHRTRAASRRRGGKPAKGGKPTKGKPAKGKPAKGKPTKGKPTKGSKGGKPGRPR
ncbi:MAG: M1 family aminopeptidase [bacterium]